MATEYVLENQPVGEAQKPPEDETKKPLHIRLIAGALAIVALILFISGIFLGKALFTQPVSPTPTPTAVPTLPQQEITPTPTGFSELPTASIKFLPGKQYFEDTYVVIQKAKPHKALLVSVDRIEQETNYTQYIKLNYFDGVDWKRKTVTNTILSSTVVTNPLLRAFSLPTTRQANDEALAEVTVDTANVSIFSSDLGNEISMQSLPGSSKFVYQGKGSIDTGTGKEEAYVFYAKTYSFNAIDLTFLTNPEAMISNWMIFWDNEGNFYHIDEQKTEQPKSAIENQKVAVKESATRSVQKLGDFTASIKTLRDKTQVYFVKYGKPIEDELELNFSNIVNKSDKKTYTWILSTAEGRVVMNEGRSVPGVGLFEYIRKNN